MWFQKLISQWIFKAAQKYTLQSTKDFELFLKDKIVLDGYGTNFNIFKQNNIVDPNEAKIMCVNAISKMNEFDEYVRKIQMQMTRGDKPTNYQAEVRFENGSLMFEHMDSSFPFSLESEGAKAVSTTSQSMRGKQIKQKKDDEKKNELSKKLENIKRTDETTYLLHANQCGYLAKHTKMRFWFLPDSKMWGTSVMTHISGISLDQLRDFVDATGNKTLSSLDIRSEGFVKDEQPEMKQIENGILATHMKFASEIVNFLNLEFVVDPVSIGIQIKQTTGDTKFKPLSAFGIDSNTIIKKLIERKPEINKDDIKEYFLEGFNGSLL